MKTTPSGKIPFKRKKKTRYFEIKEAHEKLVDDVVKAETKLVEVVDKKKKGNNRKDIHFFLFISNRFISN